MTRRPSYGARRSGSGLMPKVLLVLLLVAGFVLVLRGAFRAGPAPELAIAPSAKAIGARTSVTVTAAEPTRGLTGVKVEFVQGDRVETLVAKSYTPESAWAFWGRKTDSDAIKFELGREVQKNLKQLPATIRVTATRAPSWLRHPDPEVEELVLPVRLTPPSLAVVSSFTYVSQGGCEAVVYRVGETSVTDGVKAGAWFFPGFPLPGGGPQDRFALFAVPYDLGEVSQVKLIAEDDVGNIASASMIDKFYPRPLHRDTIPLSDAFFSKVVPPILSQTPELTDKGDLLANYLQINRDLRRIDDAELVALAQSS